VVLRLILATLFLCLLVVPAGRGQNFQQWNEVDLAARWRKMEFTTPWVARTEAGKPNSVLAATGITVDFALPRGFTLTGGYLFADLPQNSLAVHLPLMALSASFHAGKLTVADRNRLEKLIGYPGAPVRYRNRILLDLPLGQKAQRHIFADNEVIFDLSAGNWSQNRFRAGAGARLNRALFLDVYYLEREANRAARGTNVLGTDLRVTLTRKHRERK
jgi:hypothetical protein